MEKSEIFDSEEVVCDACGVTLMEGLGACSPSKFEKFKWLRRVFLHSEQKYSALKQISFS